MKADLNSENTRKGFVAQTSELHNLQPLANMGAKPCCIVSAVDDSCDSKLQHMLQKLDPELRPLFSVEQWTRIIKAVRNKDLDDLNCFVQGIQILFTKVDSYFEKDGHISMLELKKILFADLTKNFSEKRLEQIMMKYDEDKNGKLELFEFVLMMNEIRNLRSEM